MLRIVDLSVLSCHTKGIDFMASDQARREKMLQFIGRLLQNPSFKGEEITSIEMHIVNFINNNVNSLAPTLRSPDFFPNMEWQVIYRELLSVLQENVLRLLAPKLKEIAEKNLEFKVVGKLNKRRDVTADMYRKNFSDFLIKIAQCPAVRQVMDQSLKLIKARYFERYIKEFFSRREYLFIEMSKVERLHIDADEYGHFMKIMSLLRLGLYYDIPVGQGATKSIANCESESERAVLEKKLLELFKSAIPHIPSELYNPVFHHIDHWRGRDDVEASARFMAIAVHRSKTLQPNIKADRGAETPDKSWFSIMTKNAANYGYDKKMLEELHKIAFESRW